MKRSNFQKTLVSVGYTKEGQMKQGFDLLDNSQIMQQDYSQFTDSELIGCNTYLLNNPKPIPMTLINEIRKRKLQNLKRMTESDFQKLVNKL